MSENQRKILDMLAEGKISVDEAEKLLSALESEDAGKEKEPATKGTSKYLRVVVNPGLNSKSKEKVNVRIPINLIRAGLKWAAFIPKDARSKVNDALQEKGIEMDPFNIRPEDIEELISAMDELTVDVEGSESVQIFCE